jgi:hypothetical protein
MNIIKGVVAFVCIATAAFFLGGIATAGTDYSVFGYTARLLRGTAVQSTVNYRPQYEQRASDGAYGAAALFVYASKCMAANDPLRTQTVRKMAELADAFTEADRRAAGAEVLAMINRDGLRTFCRTTEAAVARL